MGERIVQSLPQREESTVTYKVIQWATGVVGKSAIRGILRHPKLELAGVKVYSEEKEGLDAGAIIGAEDTGVLASRDVEAVLASDADCVIYAPLPWDPNDICQLLESGKHVVTPCPYFFPYVQSPEVVEMIDQAAKVGKVSFLSSGCNPGGIAERFPLTFTGWCDQIDRIQMTECGDCREYSSEGVMRAVMNLGVTPEQADANPLKQILAKNWYESIDMIAVGLGTEVTSYQVKHDYILANQDIDTAIGVVEENTIALNHYMHIGKTRAGTEIIQEQIWYLDDLDQKRLQRKMKIPRESGWRIAIEGDVNLNIDVDFPPGLTGPTRRAGAQHDGVPLRKRGAARLRRPGARVQDLPRSQDDHGLYGNGRAPGLSAQPGCSRSMLPSAFSASTGS
jgi:hypothetical protein